MESSVRIIRLNGALKSELDNVATEVVRRARPADPVDLMSLLLEKTAVYHWPDLSKEESAAKLTAYLDAMDRLPLEAVREAFKRWDRAELYPNEPKRHAYYPQPAELNVLAEDHRLLLAKAAYRAKKAFEAPAIAPPRKERPTKAELVAMGIYDENGRLVLPKKGAPAPNFPPRGESPQQMADRLRGQAPPADEPEETF